MKKNLKRILACLLTLMLVGTSGGFAPLQVFGAETEGAKEPKELSKTTDSIVLELQKDMEYAIGVTEKNSEAETAEDITEENGGQETLLWKWAETEQYDLEKNTVTFKELLADTEYQFACRPKGSQDETDLKVSTIRTAADETPADTQTTPPADNDTSDNNVPPKDTQTAPPADNNTSDNNVPPKDTQTTPPADNDTSDDNIPPKDTQTAPPADSDTSDNNKPPEDIQTTPPDDNNTSDDNVPPKDTQTAPPVTAPPVTTPIPTVPIAALVKPEAPKAPEIDSFTDTKVVLKKTDGQEYAVLIENQAAEWIDEPVFNELNANTEYQFVTRIKSTSETEASDPSPALTVTTKKSAAKAPAAPALSKRGEDFITLQSEENLEYGISTDGKQWNWQTDTKFTGLKPGTAYQFAARAAFDPDKEMDSTVSPASTFKTYVAFNGSIKGITPDGTYYKRTKLTAAAVGSGMNNDTPAAGDSRWIPRTWNWDGKTDRKWSKAPYSVTFILNDVGTYKLTVGFELEEYTADGWKPVGNSKSVSVSFKSVNPIYTIKASAGKHGKISPDGNVQIEDGKNLTFTFTPNKDYQVEKVLVDGVSVNFKNNKYTFTDITKDHKISVTFELIDNEAAPQTDDNSPIAKLLVGMAVSAMLLIALAAGFRKKTN